MGQETQTTLPFFRRLATDVTANTIAISAASLVPLMAMVGGGVDASRYYMAETRLQAACDAGALAARRAMDKDDFTTEHRTIGNNFFDHNYEDGLFGLENMSRQYAADGDGIVTGTASGDMPTSIMGVFGYQQFDIDVTCSADINISNTDIMFVLDVTGSMNRCPDGTYSCNTSDNRINSLRNSALTFYDTVDAATSDRAQIRYGIVPYSQQVNVGNSIPTQYMKTSHTYQSREAEWTETIIPGETTPGSTSYVRTGGGYNYYVQTTGDEADAHGLSGPVYTSSSNSCRNTYRVDFWDIDPVFDTSAWTQVSQYGSPQTTVYEGVVDYGLWYWTSWNWNSSTGQCTVEYNYYRYDGYSTITVTDPGTSPDTIIRDFEWKYAPVTWNISNVYNTGSVSLPTGWEEANETHTWGGCIEEAETVNTGTWDPTPAGAYDLDIDLLPSSDAEKWAPMLPSLSYARYVDGGAYNVSGDRVLADLISTENKTDGYEICPKEARKLAEFASRTDLETWLSDAAGFTASGNTYHDIGMIWGARFISPDGIFASENTTAPNGESISRHIVFMTDGELQPINYSYNPYGLEWWDRRVTSDGSSNLSDRHAARFQAACRAARNKNISVWVVAFGTTLTQNLIDCATPGRAYSATDAASLDSAFREIAEKIAALRLTA